jgi:superfamily II DNA or RNA helicase
MKTGESGVNVDPFIRKSSSFSEFFEKAKALSYKERGDVFERIVQLHLRSQPKYAVELEHVWQLKEIPDDVREHLQIPYADEGIDLVAKHVDGTYWAIQAKYRGNPETRLSWGSKGGLSTFTSLAFTTCKNIAFGLVVSTTAKPLRKTHLTGKNVGFELYGDLLELDDNVGEGWRRLKQGLKGKSRPPKGLKPYPHQQRAIRNAKKHFLKEGNHRGKMIMPCGTGKSLTGFWIGQVLDAKEIVVAVPSLALIKQTLNIWTRESLAHGVSPKLLAVCSDSSAGSVDEDSFTAEQYDLGVPCVTDPTAIKTFLKAASDQPKIVFTTYQSSQVLAQVSKSLGHSFDLAILDEAHKTVGRKEKVFAHLLSEDNIRISKRVFMTATERFYTGNSNQIASMNDSEIYGDIFELLTFKQAIETHKIICDYRFVTIGIAQSEITALWENNDYLRIEGTELDEDTTRSLASGLALRKAYSELGVKRAISFHKSIKLADRFKNQQDQLVKAFPELTDVDTFHVSSKTSAGERNIRLRKFAKADKGLVTNARCLTEGVDIPSVDCVLFADPRQSKVDIVQAAGRAMRKFPGKTHGFIIVPLVVPENLDLETFASTTAFSNVVKTTKALAAEDERIVEYLRVISTGTNDDVGERVETELTEVLAEKVDAEILLRNLKLKVWDKVAKLNWRPFEDARKFAIELNLRGNQDWQDFAQSKERPADIPSAPAQVYADSGWVSWGDWLGTRNIHRNTMEYLSFRQAKEFARQSGIQTGKQWAKAWRDGFLPDDLPANPPWVYRNAGWTTMGDFLGTGSFSPTRYIWLDFEEARNTIRKFGLSSVQEFRDRYKNEFKVLKIPSNGPKAYKDKGWVSWGDFLGTKRQFQGLWLSHDETKALVQRLGLRSRKEYTAARKDGRLPENTRSLPQDAAEFKDWTDFFGKQQTLKRSERFTFSQAKEWVQKKGIKTATEWRKVSKAGNLPPEMPVGPEKFYDGQGWDGWANFLGTDNRSGKQLRDHFVDYKAAKKFAENLSVNSSSEWQKQRRKMSEKAEWPSDIPAYPDKTYQDRGWVSWGSFLGSGAVAISAKEYRPFKAARKFVRSLSLRSSTEWHEWRKNNLPDDIPAYPEGTYKDKGWAGWRDWLAIEERFLPFEKARKIIRSLNLASIKEWREYASSGKRPTNIPNDPSKIYSSDGWIGWKDWLGIKRRFRNYRDAAKYIRSLGLKNFKEWQRYAKSADRPPDIPAGPAQYYKDKGWVNLGDWLGTKRSANKDKKFLSYTAAKNIVQKQNLTSETEWRKYCRAGQRPNDIPSSPHVHYKNRGWVSWSEWLGTARRRQFMEFPSARAYARSLGLKTSRDWLVFSKSGKRPRDIPSKPSVFYRDEGWNSWPDWLGV